MTAMTNTLRGLTHLSLELDGSPAPPDLMGDLLTVEIDDNLHLPDMAQLRIRDSRLDWMQSPLLALGKRVIVKIRNEGGDQKVFDGEIAAIEATFDQHAGPSITLRAYDLSHRLHRDRKTRSFRDQTDSDIAEKIARDAGIPARVESTRSVQKHVLQDNQTDWEFLWGRARRNGCRVFVEEGQLHFKEDPNEPATVPLEWGVNLLRFGVNLASAEQVQEVIVRGWDVGQKREIIGRAGRPVSRTDVEDQGTGGSATANAFALSARAIVVDQPVSTQMEADHLAQAICNDLGEAFLTAEGTCAGNPHLMAGTIAQIDGLGPRYSGSYFITRATHRYETGGHTTEITVSGHRTRSLAELLTVASRGGRGVAIGLVTNNRDPDGMGRVKVRFPWLMDDHESDWARIASPMAGNGRGFMFTPEVNDEVLVAFEHGSIDRPYVVGVLWNGQDHPPASTDEAVSSNGDVQRRVIRTRVGHEIVLIESGNDEGIVIRDSTGNNVVHIATRTNSVRIAADSKVVIESSGTVVLNAREDVEINAGGKLKLAGQRGVNVQGTSGNVDIKGTRINLN